MTDLFGGMPVASKMHVLNGKVSGDGDLFSARRAYECAVVANAEEFNTRYGSLVGFQEAVRKVKPIARAAPQFDLSLAIASSGARTAADAVDHLSLRLLRVPVDAEVRAALIVFLEKQLGTADLERAAGYSERPLRLAAHLIMSTPEFQLC